TTGMGCGCGTSWDWREGGEYVVPDDAVAGAKRFGRTLPAQVDLNGDPVEHEIHPHGQHGGRRGKRFTLPGWNGRGAASHTNRRAPMRADIEIRDLGGVEHRHRDLCRQSLQGRTGGSTLVAEVDTLASEVVDEVAVRGA